jgi:hypothetical protein
VCDSATNFSKKFWWEVNPKKHQEEAPRQKEVTQVLLPMSGIDLAPQTRSCLCQAKGVVLKRAVGRRDF